MAYLASIELQQDVQTEDGKPALLLARLLETGTLDQPPDGRREAVRGHRVPNAKS
jgi:hypothetical protein